MKLFIHSQTSTTGRSNSIPHFITHAITYPWCSPVDMRREANNTLRIMLVEGWAAGQVAYKSQLILVPRKTKLADVELAAIKHCRLQHRHCYRQRTTGVGIKIVTEIQEKNIHDKCTVRCRYNAVNFLHNPHDRHPIARPWGRAMGCLSVVILISNLLSVTIVAVSCCDKLDRVITVYLWL